MAGSEKACSQKCFFFSWQNVNKHSSVIFLWQDVNKHTGENCDVLSVKEVCMKEICRHKTRGKNFKKKYTIYDGVGKKYVDQNKGTK